MRRVALLRSLFSGDGRGLIGRLRRIVERRFPAVSPGVGERVGSKLLPDACEHVLVAIGLERVQRRVDGSQYAVRGTEETCGASGLAERSRGGAESLECEADALCRSE